MGIIFQGFFMRKILFENQQNLHTQKEKSTYLICIYYIHKNKNKITVYKHFNILGTYVYH